jgi:ornithine carbamoyltransferase
VKSTLLHPNAVRKTADSAPLGRHFLDLTDWDGEQIRKLLKDAARLKKKHERGANKPLLAGRVLGMIFEKPSLRTRVSFEAAMAQLGGASIFLSNQDAALGKRESIADFARTISQYVDAVVLRTFAHARVEEFAAHSACPVINGLSDYFHPCQALGDLLTVQESFGDLSDQTIVFVGDGNNVARSLALACGKLGLTFVLCAPKGYGFDAAFHEMYQETVKRGPVREEPEPRKALARADVIYTDVWASMGQEEEGPQRRKAFAAYQVNQELLDLAPKGVKVMHCLPAHRGEEITDDVLDGEASVAFPQAGNRMHAQKALLVWMLRNKPA